MASSPLSDPALTDFRSALVKNARSLLTRDVRQQQRRFLAEGPAVVREALVGVLGREVVVHDLFVGEDVAARRVDLIEMASQADVPIRLASAQVMAKLSDTVTPQSLVAVCGFVDQPLHDLLGASPRLVAVFAEIRDPGNAGSVLRNADAAGADAVVFSAGSVDPYNGKAVRASAGSLFHVPLVTDVPLLNAVEQLRASGMQILAADAAAEHDLDAVTKSGMLAEPTAWLFGNEAHGLPNELKQAADATVAVPIYGKAESLNLATAAALCLYASSRAQRND